MDVVTGGESPKKEPWRSHTEYDVSILTQRFEWILEATPRTTKDALLQGQHTGNIDGLNKLAMYVFKLVPHHGKLSLFQQLASKGQKIFVCGITVLI